MPVRPGPPIRWVRPVRPGHRPERPGVQPRPPFPRHLPPEELPIPWRPRDVPPIYWDPLPPHTPILLTDPIFDRRPGSGDIGPEPGCKEWEDYPGRCYDQPPVEIKGRGTCSSKYPSYVKCPKFAYDDRHEACGRCNTTGYRPDNKQDMWSTTFGQIAQHWRCLAPGKGPIDERRGVSVICGVCCIENDGDPQLVVRCICGSKGDDDEEDDDDLYD